MSPESAYGPADPPGTTDPATDGTLVLKTFGSGDVAFVSVWDTGNAERWIQSTLAVPVER